MAKLEPEECIVNMTMDEVYTIQGVEVAGSRYYGETDGILTKTIFCIHSNSISGKYGDMVSMQPVAQYEKKTSRTPATKLCAV